MKQVEDILLLVFLDTKPIVFDDTNQFVFLPVVIYNDLHGAWDVWVIDCISNQIYQHLLEPRLVAHDERRENRAPVDLREMR